MKSYSQSLIVSLLLSLFSMVAQADGRLSLGVALNGISWEGDNGPGLTNFSSDSGGQFGVSASYSREKWYVGLSLQGGDYDFNNSGPTQFTSAGEVTTSNVEISHSDFDLLAGYYFWERVSLFLDLKSVTSEWQNNGYEQSFSGLGLGISAYNPLNDKWTLYGSWGVVGGDIEQGDNTELGDAKSSALVLGANYSVDATNHINMGMRLRSYEFDYDDGNQQDYDLNGLFVGYNHVFEM